MKKQYRPKMTGYAPVDRPFDTDRLGAGAFAGADHHFVFPRLVSEVTVPVGAPEFGEEQVLAIEEGAQVDADFQDIDVIDPGGTAMVKGDLGCKDGIGQGFCCTLGGVRTTRSSESVSGVWPLKRCALFGAIYLSVAVMPDDTFLFFVSLFQ
jgi:hypothetical protein